MDIWKVIQNRSWCLWKDLEIDTDGHLEKKIIEEGTQVVKNSLLRNFER